MVIRFEISNLIKPALFEANKDQTFYLLKAALLFSNDETKFLTFWRDRSKAILYANGKFDSEEGPLGWGGFEFRFGSLMNNEQNPKLRQYQEVNLTYIQNHIFSVVSNGYHYHFSIGRMYFY
jgi:hypothetical protein